MRAELTAESINIEVSLSSLYVECGGLKHLTASTFHFTGWGWKDQWHKDAVDRSIIEYIYTAIITSTFHLLTSSHNYLCHAVIYCSQISDEIVGIESISTAVIKIEVCILPTLLAVQRLQSNLTAKSTDHYLCL